MEGRLTQPRVSQEDKKRHISHRPAQSAAIDASRLNAKAKRRREIYFTLLIVTGALLITTLLRMMLQPVLLQDYPFATYAIAVFIVSAICGMRLGMLTALLGAAIGIPFFAKFSGPGSLATPTGWIGLAEYFGTSLVISALCGSIVSARRQAERVAKLATEGQQRLEREIEARELAQDAAREANDRTTRLLDKIAEAVMALDLDWNVLYANENALALLGTPRDMLMNSPLTATLSGELMAKLGDSRRTGLPTSFEIYDPLSKLWTEYRVHPTADGMTVFGRDITEEKRTRDALEASDQRYRAFLAQSSDSIWRFELERPVPTDLPIDEQIEAFYRYGYLAECNDTMARHHGFISASDVIGKRLNELLPRDDSRSIDYLRKFIRSNFRLESAESMNLAPGGQRHYYLNNLLGIQRDGMLHRAWGIQRDVTKQKQAESAVKKLNSELEERVEERTVALRSANRELESFCYSVSHDLRAPLRSVISQSNILLEDHAAQLDEDGVGTLQRLIKAAKNMASTVETLLELSKLQRKEMNKEDVDLSELADFIAQDIKARGACPKTEFRIESSLKVHADKGLIRVALVNLMENACKFASRGEDPCVEVGSLDKNGAHTYFVRDNGVGFDMQYVDKIFQPFERLHRAEEFPGTGIGLANVLRVIERHGGRVWAEGEIGKGATFYFTL